MVAFARCRAVLCTRRGGPGISGEQLKQVAGTYRAHGPYHRRFSRNFCKPDKEKVDFQLDEELGKTSSLVEGNFQGQQIVIELDAKSLPVVHGYPNAFAQLLNSLLNARDALAERKNLQPKVFITIAAKTSKAVVTVTDACGIAEELREKIFDPYFTTKGPQAGTQLGLFMSKTIIGKHMGGHLKRAQRLRRCRIQDRDLRGALHGEL